MAYYTLAKLNRLDKQNKNGVKSTLPGLGGNALLVIQNPYVPAMFS